MFHPLIPSQNSKMAGVFLLSVVSFLGSQSVWASPLAASNASSLQQCAQQMDGRLPSVTPQGFNFSGSVRRYYVAAEEVEWDYGPTGWDNWMGVRILILFTALAALTLYRSP